MFGIVFDKLGAEKLGSEVWGPVIIEIWNAARSDMIRTRGEASDPNWKSVKGWSVMIGGDDTLHVKIDQEELVSIVEESISIIGGRQKEKFLIQDTKGASL